MASPLLYVIKRSDAVEAIAKELEEKRDPGFTPTHPWGGWVPVNPYGMNRPTYGIPRDPKVLEAVTAFRSEADAWTYLFGIHADGTDEMSDGHRHAMRKAWKVVALEEVAS